MDLLFPFIFRWIESGLDPHFATEDARQHSLFIKLTMVRVVTFSVFLYAAVPWTETLDDARLITLLTVQLMLGVAVPLIQGLDFRGVYRRWITAPRMAMAATASVSVSVSDSDGQGESRTVSVGGVPDGVGDGESRGEREGGGCNEGVSSGEARQDRVNHCWEHSSDFILAEHSSRVVSTCCVCLLHLVIAPLSGLVLLLALLVTFATEYFLLARRHRAVHVFRSQMANSFVIALLVVLCMHAYMSCRLVYSWPYDEAFINEEGLVERVDKTAPLLLWEVANRDTRWHSDTQGRFVSVYRALTWLLACCLVLILVAKGLHLCSLLDRVHAWRRERKMRGKGKGRRGEEDEDDEDVFSCQHKYKKEKEGQKRRQRHVMRYSGVQHIGSYCPLLREQSYGNDNGGDGSGGGGGEEVLLCCDVTEVLPRYLPQTHCEYRHESTNLTAYVSDSTCDIDWLAGWLAD